MKYASLLIKACLLRRLRNCGNMRIWLSSSASCVPGGRMIIKMNGLQISMRIEYIVQGLEHTKLNMCKKTDFVRIILHTEKLLPFLSMQTDTAVFILTL
jgi:hypothetical protein